MSGHERCSVRYQTLIRAAQQVQFHLGKRIKRVLERIVGGDGGHVTLAAAIGKETFYCERKELARIRIRLAEFGQTGEQPGRWSWLGNADKSRYIRGYILNRRQHTGNLLDVDARNKR